MLLWLMNLGFAGGPVEVIVPTTPGLEYTLPDGLVHYTLPDNRTEYELPENRLHYTMREED